MIGASYSTSSFVLGKDKTMVYFSCRPSRDISTHPTWAPLDVVEPSIMRIHSPDLASSMLVYACSKVVWASAAKSINTCGLMGLHG